MREIPDVVGWLMMVLLVGSIFTLVGLSGKNWGLGWRKPIALAGAFLVGLSFTYLVLRAATNG